MKSSQILMLAAVSFLLMAFGFQSHSPPIQAQQTQPIQLASTDQTSPMRYFLFSAKPSAEAWQFMKNNPGDRKAATAAAMKTIGGEMIAYYWGLTTGRNYIIAALPDGRTAQAMLIQRLSSDLVLEYEAIELVESSEIPAVFDRLKEIEAADDTVK